MTLLPPKKGVHCLYDDIDKKLPELPPLECVHYWRPPRLGRSCEEPQGSEVVVVFKKQK